MGMHIDSAGDDDQAMRLGLAPRGARPVLAEHGSPRWLAVGEVLGEVGRVGREEPRPRVREIDAVGHVPGGMPAGGQHPYAGSNLGIAGELAPLHWEVGVVRLVVA